MNHILKLFLCLSFGLALSFCPVPEGVSIQSWHLFSIFVATIFGIILKAMPVGALCIFALTIAIMTKNLTIQEGLSGFSNPVIWLIVLAFFIARSFVKTGLGTRIAYLFIYLTGKKSLMLAYRLAGGDLHRDYHRLHWQQAKNPLVDGQC